MVVVVVKGISASNCEQKKAREREKGDDGGRDNEEGADSPYNRRQSQLPDELRRAEQSVVGGGEEVATARAREGERERGGSRKQMRGRGRGCRRSRAIQDGGKSMGLERGQDVCQPKSTACERASGGAGETLTSAKDARSSPRCRLDCGCRLSCWGARMRLRTDAAASWTSRVRREQPRRPPFNLHAGRRGRQTCAASSSRDSANARRLAVVQRRTT